MDVRRTREDYVDADVNVICIMNEKIDAAYSDGLPSGMSYYGM